MWHEWKLVPFPLLRLHGENSLYRSGVGRSVGVPFGFAQDDNVDEYVEGNSQFSQRPYRSG
jgi:hypothetical protein